MKVVDMFGCHLPVCSIDYQGYYLRFYDFSRLYELVTPGTGMVFKDPDQLCQQVYELFSDQDRIKLKEMRKNIRSEQILSWEENWNERALPIFI